MNRNIIHILWMAAVLLTSCSQEELPDMNGTAPLTISVTDGGFNGASRAVESGYRMEFTAGDECGLYIVRGGAVVNDNVKLTATEGPDGALTWQPAAGVTLAGGLKDEKYFLYYPYRSDLSDLSDLSDDATFFRPLIDSWQPATDQSSYAAYTASDLMTAQGRLVRSDASTAEISFSMTHRMALAVIELPKTVYRFTNADGTIPDYTVATPADFTGGTVQPYTIAPGTYRCIVNPASGTAASIPGSYAYGKKEFTITTSNIAASSYKTYKVGGEVNEIQHNLQVGDFLMADGTLVSKDETLTYEQKANLAAIVFYVGRHENDASDYSVPLYVGVSHQLQDNTVHGYAVALKDATSGYCMWGLASIELGCCPTDGAGNKQDNYDNPDIDWCGYSWTQKIITAAGGKGNLNATEQDAYPATYYAVVSYETDCNAPSNSSGWFLPSIGQMWKIYQNRSSLFGSVSGAEVLKSDSYWSSSEDYDYPAGNALYVDVSDDNVYGSHKRSRSSCVRPVLAF